jgi:hypothetical protein
VTNSRDRTGLPIPGQHKNGIPAERNGIDAHSITATGPTTEPSKTVVPCKRYRGSESSPLRYLQGVLVENPAGEAGLWRLCGRLGDILATNSPPAHDRDGLEHTGSHRSPPPDVGKITPEANEVTSPIPERICVLEPLWVVSKLGRWGLARHVIEPG